MSAAGDVAVTGGCRCGAIQYQSNVLPLDLTNCFCFTCRRLSGAPFLPFFSFPVTAVTWMTTRPDALRRTKYSEHAERAHCAECGMQLSMVYDIEPDLISLTAGSVDDGSVQGSLPQAAKHIFVDEKPSWYLLPADNIPRYGAFTPGFTQALEASKTEVQRQ